jgi:CAP-Gly domain-containing linker protein 1
MPPPASPMSSRSTSHSITGQGQGQAATSSNFEPHGRILQEQAVVLISGKDDPSVPSRSASATSFRSNTTDEHDLIAQLQSRIGALEYDNERLRSVSSIPSSDTCNDAQLRTVEQERDDALRRIAQLEAEFLASETSLQNQHTQSSSLEQELRRVAAELETLQLSRDNRFEDMQKKAEDAATLVKTLDDAVDRQAAIARQQEALCKTREAEITDMEIRIERAYAELQDEKNELGAQIEELRMAGQVCFLRW